MNDLPKNGSRIRVKFLSRVKLPDLNVGENYTRRFPQRVPSWGSCDFIFDRNCREYDWLVVYDDLPRSSPIENLGCPREQTLLITGEPSSITYYGRRFLQQFGYVLTSQESWAITHPNIIRQQPGLLWYYGGNDERGSYDSLVEATPPTKSKVLSSVCSAKAMTHTLHSRRLEFTKRLMQDLPEFDVFGYGMRPLSNKADAIAPYKYHLAIENHSCDHHWTEKLADAFLGFSLPIYLGCTNLDTYFPKNSYVAIDIHDYPNALKIIRDLIAGNVYEERLPAILEARAKILQEYSTFPQLAKLIEARNPVSKPPRENGKLFGRRRFRKKYPVSALLDGCAKIVRRP